MSEYSELSTLTKIHPSEVLTAEHIRAYLYGHKKVQLIDTTKIHKERIKHLHINKEPKGNSCKLECFRGRKIRYCSSGEPYL